MSESQNKASTSKPTSKVEIQLDPEVMKGNFANITNIVHSKEEFILDFIFLQQQPAPFGKLISRMIITPAHAKRLLNALQDNIQKYENQFGTLAIEPVSPTSQTLQ